MTNNKLMTDAELIRFLWELLWAGIVDGDMPSQDEFETLKTELNLRKIIDGEFPC